MSKKEVRVLERNMQPPDGVRFTATSLTIATPNEATLLEAGAWLQRVEDCRAWWWGDYMVAYCGWRLIAPATGTNKKVNLADPEEVEAAQIRYTSEFSKAAGVDSYTLRGWKQLAEFYPVGRRHPTLSPTHHEEAKNGARGNLTVALDWLQKAEEQEMSASQLRAAIKTQAMARSEPHEPMPTNRMQELFAFARWARAQQKNVEELAAEEARVLRTELEPAAKLIATLDAKLSGALGGGPTERHLLAAQPYRGIASRVQ